MTATDTPVDAPVGQDVQRGDFLGQPQRLIDGQHRIDALLLGIPVTYYPLLVTEQFDVWPEKDRRQRHWALIEDAPRVAYREDQLPLIRQFEDLRRWITEAAERCKSERPAALTPAP
jgi:hypothetical protein